MRQVWRVLALAAMTSTGISAASAQDGTTVQSLLKEEFEVVGTMGGTGGGAALFLRKKDRLVFCYVTETRDSKAVTTQYCKPVQ